MSPRTFQFHMDRFRVLAAVRSARRGLGAKTVSLLPRVWAGVLWMRNVVLTPLWISFALYIGLWERLERRYRDTHRLRTWHRAVLCCGLSIALGLGVTVGMGWGIQAVTLLLGALYGCAVFATWKRGARWLGQLLGARPVRSGDSASAYAGLDLGN